MQSRPIASLVSHLPDSYARTLSLAEAKSLLQRIARSQVRSLLHGAEEAVFLQAAALGRFTNTQLAARTDKSKQQIQKYLKSWLELNLVAQRERNGRNQFYATDPRFAVLKLPAP